MVAAKHPQSTRAHARHAAVTAVIMVVLLAGALRFIGLDWVMPGINQDEASHAFQAYCVLKTGQDQFGESWPLFFRSFGEYVAAPAIYAKIPGQMLLGMNVLSTRLPHALLGTLNVLFLYLLIKTIYGYRPAILSAVLLAISAWHIQLSRLAFEVSMCPPLLTLGLYLIARGVSQQPASIQEKKHLFSLLGLTVAGFAIGAALWTYNAYRVAVPMLIFGGALLYVKPLWRWIRQPGGCLKLGLLVCGFALAVAPFVYASITVPEKAWAHATGESIIHDVFSISQKVTMLVRGCAMHWSPKFLFVSGDRYCVQSVPGYGQLHHFLAILLPLGLYRVITRRKTERFGLFVLFWILIAPLPAALTPLEGAHSLRSAAVLPAYQILAALGLDMLLNAAKERSAKLYRLTVTTSAVLITLNVGYFCYLFFAVYPNACARAFAAEWQPVVREVEQIRSQYDAILLTNRGTNQLGIIYLFWSGIEPERYFKMHRSIDQGGYWDYTIQIGKVVFAPSDFVHKLIQQLPPNAKILIAERPGFRVPGRELKRFHHHDGKVAIILYHVQSEDLRGSR